MSTKPNERKNYILRQADGIMGKTRTHRSGRTEIRELQRIYKGTDERHLNKGTRLRDSLEKEIVDFQDNVSSLRCAFF